MTYLTSWDLPDFSARLKVFKIGRVWQNMYQDRGFSFMYLKSNYFSLFPSPKLYLSDAHNPVVSYNQDRLCINSLLLEESLLFWLHRYHKERRDERILSPHHHHLMYIILENSSPLFLSWSFSERVSTCSKSFFPPYVSIIWTCY